MSTDTNNPPPVDDARDNYQPRTRERLIEILTARAENPRSWQAEAAAMLAAPSPTADEARHIAKQLRHVESDGSISGDAIARLCDKAAALLSRIPSEEAVWIKWPGGDCPVPVETFVEAEFRNAQIDSDVARRFIWDHTDSRFDIVAFRITRAPGAGT